MTVAPTSVRRTSSGRCLVYDRLKSLWEDGLRSHFRVQQSTWWEQEQPAIVLVPNTVVAAEIKRLMLQDHFGHVGLRFLFPSDLRKWLSRRYAMEGTPLDRATATLFLSSIATLEKDHSSARALRAAPEAILEAWESAHQAGAPWPEGEAIAPLIRAFEEKLADHDCLPDWKVDEQLILRGPSKAIIRQIYIIGFDGSSWPLWKLLAAAVRASQETFVCIPQGQVETERPDLLWLGTWQHLLGDATHVTSTRHPFEDHVESLRTGSSLEIPPQPKDCVRFLSAHSLEMETACAAHAAVEILGSNRLAQVTIAAPRDGVLAREICLKLAELEIPHYDTFGFPPAREDDVAAWEAWLAWQEEPFARKLDEFLTRARHLQLPASPAHRRELIRCVRELYHDPIAAVTLRLRQSENPPARELGEWLVGMQPPKEGLLYDHFAHLIKALEAMKWEKRLGSIKILREGYESLLNLECEHAAFIRWLRVQTTQFQSKKNLWGSHPFARIFVVPHAQAGVATCTHLIFAGVNQGIWPGEARTNGFLTQEKIAEANREAAPGDAECVRPGMGYLLSHQELRGFEEKIFLQGLDVASKGCVVLWASADETDNGTPMLPSEFVSRLFFAEKARLMTREDLRKAERDALALAASPQPRGKSIPQEKIEPTLKAFQARRKVAEPFGEFHFCLKKAPSVRLSISATDLEEMISNPAPVWLKLYLGAEPCEMVSAGEAIAPLVIGNHVHRNLQRVIDPDRTRRFQKIPDAKEAHSRLLHITSGRLASLRKIFQEAGLQLPLSCLALHQTATSVTEAILRDLIPAAGGHWGHCEWNIPTGTEIPLDEGCLLLLHGRSDLIFSTTLPEKGDVPEAASVIDFKTSGSKLQIKPEEGDGLQVILYALAAKKLGSGTVNARLLTPGGFSKMADDSFIATCRGTLLRLARMQESGAFGQSPGTKNEAFSHQTPLPFATLSIPNGILFQKAARHRPEAS